MSSVLLHIRAVLHARDSMLRKLYRKSRLDLNRGMKAAKTKYKNQIKADHKKATFVPCGEASRTLQTTNSGTTLPPDTSLQDHLNSFFSRFEDTREVGGTHS